MKYLIDTQILIWTIIDPNRLSINTLSILRQNIILVSQITLFEIAIKQKIQKLPELNISMPILIEHIKEDNFEILNIKNQHISAYSQIPLLNDHRDPFDRLILATAFSENIPVLSADERFKDYKSIIRLIEN